MSLEGAYEGDNIFAKILRGGAPCVKVTEDDDTLVFMDIFPQSPGHCLVIPKNVQARNLLDCPPERLGPLFTRVQAVAQAVTKALSPDGVVVTQFNGAPAGQTVFHLHVHIIPRYDNLPLAGHGHGKMADMDALRSQADRIAAAMNT
ncbi:MAG: HIT family protein [Hyphomonadaceae bacterium]